VRGLSSVVIGGGVLAGGAGGGDDAVEACNLGVEQGHRQFVLDGLVEAEETCAAVGHLE
jgi:hypothetical protein